MTRSLLRRSVLVLAIAVATAGSGQAQTSPDVPRAVTFTRAEQLLFVSDHLRNLKLPAQLEYRYEKRGKLEPEVDDRATVDITRDGKSKVSRVAFLSGARRFELPAIPDVEGNPIILYFLEREIREMNRLTKGSMNYYRKRIRMALADQPQVDEVDIQLDGRTIKATQIVIAPYLEDPARSRYEEFATKRYVLTLSDDIPGGVYRLHTELSGRAESGAAAPLVIAETLTFIRQSR